MADLRRKLLFLPPILTGIAVLAFVVSKKQAPETKPPGETARHVRVIELRPVDFVPRVSGFGTVKPGKTWAAISQVGGEVAYVHPNLKKGAILAAGIEIIRISPLDFKLAIAQVEANIRASEARVKQFSVTETNTREVLKIEKRALEIAETELERQKKLLTRGNVSQNAVDTKTRETLTQRKMVRELENNLRLLPIQRDAEIEQKAVYEAQLQSAKLDLERTRIALPFDARVVEANVEVAQYAKAGEALASVDGVETAEIEAQVPVARFQNMAEAVAGDDMPAGVSSGTLKSLVERMGFEVAVQLKTGNHVTEWPARFARISDTIDPKTRTVGVIAVVDEPYAQAIPGKRPPLAKGLFVEVLLSARALRGQMVVPRSTLRESRLHVVGKENRLDVREVRAGLFQGDVVTITKGLAFGEKVVVSDLSPAVPGMLLAPTVDQRLADALSDEASSRDAAR